MEDIIKKILKDDSEKLIIMDNGRPKFVVMSYNYYLKLTSENSDNQKLEMDFNELINPVRDGASKMSDGCFQRPISNGIKGVKQNTASNRELSLEDLPLA